MSDTITTPGKFEGEPVWVPHFWELALEGVGDDVYHGGHLWTYLRPDDENIKKWPELAECRYVGVYEDDQGFVHAIQTNNIPEADDNEE